MPAGGGKWFRTNRHFFRTRCSSVTSFRLLSIGNIHLNSTIHPQSQQFIKVNHNVPYSRVHPRNVVDIYELTTTNSQDSSATATIETSYHDIDLSAKSSSPKSNMKPSSNELKDSLLPRISILFIHGGMWLRGDKSQPILSLTDIVSELLSSSSNHHRTHSSTTTNEKLSNIGITTSLAGATTYVINYRLAGHRQRDNATTTTTTNDDDENSFGGHPHQVTDIARSIAYALEREHRLSTMENRSHPPQLFVGGHSAGAHLGALALCDPRWLRLALSERWSSSSSPVAAPQRDLWRESLAGFFGISGVYNLSRLRMNPASDVIFGAVFRKDVGMDEASPVQALLRHGDGKDADGRPPILDMDVLLLNAKENDFGLEKDAEEFMVALNSLDRRCSSRKKLPQKRHHYFIEGRNHLSIMRDFGSGINLILPGLKSSGAKSPDGQDESSLGLLYNGIGSIYSSAFSYLMEEKVDDTAIKVLEFTSLKEPLEN